MSHDSSSPIANQYGKFCYCSPPWQLICMCIFLWHFSILNTHMYNTARVLQEGAANFVWAPLPGGSAVCGRACHSSLGWHLVVTVFCKFLW